MLRLLRPTSRNCIRLTIASGGTDNFMCVLMKSCLSWCELATHEVQCIVIHYHYAVQVICTTIIKLYVIHDSMEAHCYTV